MTAIGGKQPLKIGSLPKHAPPNNGSQGDTPQAARA